LEDSFSLPSFHGFDLGYDSAFSSHVHSLENTPRHDEIEYVDTLPFSSDLEPGPGDVEGETRYINKRELETLSKMSPSEVSSFSGLKNISFSAEDFRLLFSDSKSDLSFSAGLDGQIEVSFLKFCESLAV